jgi:hypothetical protein
MMTLIPRVDRLLDVPFNALTGEQVSAIVSELPDSAAYVMCQLKSRPGDPLTPESMARDLALIRRWPRSLEYYGQRAEEARRRKLTISAGARQESLLPVR